MNTKKFINRSIFCKNCNSTTNHTFIFDKNEKEKSLYKCMFCNHVTNEK